jgi:hypothetical protein
VYLYKVRVLDGQGVVTGDKDTTVREWFTSKGSDRQGGWNLTDRAVGMDFQAMRCVGNIDDRFSL